MKKARSGIGRPLPDQACMIVVLRDKLPVLFLNPIPHYKNVSTFHSPNK
jgi:hypothetical protein